MRRRSSLRVGALCTAYLLSGTGCVSGEHAASDDSAIMGGAPATEYPEAVQINLLTNQGAAVCSGALIAPRVVLTAGHCVNRATAWLVASNAGLSFTRNATVFDYTDLGSNVNFTQHDIGLVFLDTPIQLASYPSIATGPVVAGTQLMKVGRIKDGSLQPGLGLFERAIQVSFDPAAPFDYRAPPVGQQGDSGGPDFILGTHTIAAVNSGGGSMDSIARVDLLHDFIQAQVDAHGGGGGGGVLPPGPAPQAPGVIPNGTLAVVDRYDVVTPQLNCRAGPGKEQPVVQTLNQNDAVVATSEPSRPRIATAPDGAPWLLVQPPAGATCYVSANTQFIQPTKG
jgi:hypothetical protein